MNQNITMLTDPRKSKLKSEHFPVRNVYWIYSIHLVYKFIENNHIIKYQLQFESV